MHMKHVESYRISGAELRTKPLKDIVSEYHLASDDVSSSFSISKGFLHYKTYKVKKVKEENTLILGSKMFTIDDQLRIYELPANESMLEDCTSWYNRRRCMDGTCGMDCAEVSFQLQDILVRKGMIVPDPIRVHRKNVGGRDLLLITTIDMIYVEYDGYVASKPHNIDIYEIDMNSYEAVGLSSSLDIFDLYLTLQIFVNLPVELGARDRMEKYLFRLFVFSDVGAVLLERLMSSCANEMEMVLCRLYRKVDDKGKKKMSRWMGNIRSQEALKLIIIYFPHEIERYIQLCISEEKEYEIEELIEHYKGTELLEKVAVILLNNNCFYLFCICKPEYEARFESLTLVEKYNMKTQRNIHRVRRS